MPVTAEICADNALAIKVSDQFDFGDQQEFERSYLSVDATIERYIIDFAATDYLDSSALGLLLMLRDHAGRDKSNIEIINCNDTIKRLLTISRFKGLFTIQ